MKVILLQDIKGVGKKGQLLDASDGHAKNYLIPRKMAMEASKANLNELEQKKKSEESKRQRELEKAQALAKSLQESAIRVSVKTGENGKLFGSVTSKEIASALLSQAGIDLDRKKIHLPEPIKAIGEKQVEIKLHSQVAAKITVQVVEQG